MDRRRQLVGVATGAAVALHALKAGAISGSSDMSGLGVLALLAVALAVSGALVIQIGLGLLLLDARGQRVLWVLLGFSPVAAWLLGMLPWLGQYASVVVLAPLPTALWIAKRPRTALALLAAMIALGVGLGLCVRIGIEQSAIWPVALGHSVLSVPLTVAVFRRRRRAQALLLPFGWFVLIFALIRVSLWLT